MNYVNYIGAMGEPEEPDEPGQLGGEEEPAELPPEKQPAAIELLLRLLQQYSGPQHGSAKPRLLPGDLPANLPFSLPLPPGAKLAGSVAWRRFAEVVFDCDLSPDQVTAFYEQELLPNGWISPTPQEPWAGVRGGFAPSGPFGPFGVGVFCQGETGPWIVVRPWALPDMRPGPVYVAVHYTGAGSPCSPALRQQVAGMRPMMRSALPDLRAPQGALQTPGGASGGAGGWHSRAWLKTDLDLTATLAHYDAQVEKAGWTRHGGGQAGPVGWSAWDLRHEGENWHGILTAVADPWQQGVFRLLLEAESEAGPRRRERFFPPF